MRVITRKPLGFGLGEGDVVGGYLVEGLVADRQHAELICHAVGPNAEPVTLVVGWRRPADRHAWSRIRRLTGIRVTLVHTALLPVHAVGVHSGRPYLVMERYPATTFEALLDDGPLSPERVLTLLAPVCDALDLAHATGLVHQSLSGTSLLMEGETALLDGFGLAGGPRELTLGSVGGHEIRYCPPEELGGRALEPGSNVYSLAALLVHALTGVPAYEGTSAVQAYGHLVAPPPRPSERRPELGGAFDGVIARAMAKEPADRPRSAGELLAESAAALGVELPPRAGSEEGEDRGRGNPAAIRISHIAKPAVAAAAVVAALAGLAAGVALDPFDGSRAPASGPSVDARALARLDQQRTPLRARLARSESPQAQAATAADLADAYGRAARTLESQRLASAAREAERAYKELGTAAQAVSSEQFAAASDEIARADAQIASATNASR